MVGAGAAGLATAIFARRGAPDRPVTLVDSARKPGAKILVSGGTRCNVTNLVVSERDFWGGRSTVVRRILRAFPIADTIAFFNGIGVPMHEETGGKLFPNTNRARDVLAALLAEAERSGVQLLTEHRVLDLVAHNVAHGDADVSTAGAADGGFRLTTNHGDLHADAIVLATGGRSLPKTGSDGAGFDLAARLGHAIVPTTPALVPLLLTDHVHRALSGVSQEAELTVWVDGRAHIRLSGSLLWTHFGISGPVVLNASRHLLRAELEQRPTSLTANFCGGASFDEVDARWTAMAAERPRLSLQQALATMAPGAFAEAALAHLALNGAIQLAHFGRPERRRLVHALVEWPLPVSGSRGYSFAEVTAGGVALEEIDPATMESRICPGLYFVGEILDVDGRIGGFNFQWAWATGYVAGRALSAR